MPSDIQMPLTFAIDYDGTFDRAVSPFRNFIRDLKLIYDARVFIVSSRHCECDEDSRCESHRDLAEATGCSVILTSGSAKKWFMEQRGIKVDIWVDDCPESILQSK